MDEVIENDIRAAAKEVFKFLGAGQTEQCYEEALEVEFILRGYKDIRRQVPCPIEYKGYVVGVGYIDLVLKEDYVLELKTVNNISIKDEAQIRKYLHENQTGFLINFNPAREMAEVFKIEKSN